MLTADEIEALFAAAGLRLQAGYLGKQHMQGQWMLQVGKGNGYLDVLYGNDTTEMMNRAWEDYVNSR
jgi:hypothetical protein